MKIYLANSLFSQADRDFNTKVAHSLRAFGGDVYVPQENMSINNKSQAITSTDIVKADLKELMDSDIMVAIIDGETIDSGVAAEIGAFYTTGRPIVGLCTDVRFNNEGLKGKMSIIFEDIHENQIMYKNLFVIGMIKERGAIKNNVWDIITHIKEGK